jgi:hypothetical protein
MFNGSKEAATDHVIGFTFKNWGNEILKFLRRVLLVGVAKCNRNWIMRHRMFEAETHHCA